MTRKNVLSLLIGLVLAFAAPLAHALVPYASTSTSPLVLPTNSYQVISFSSPSNPLLSATLTLDISSAQPEVRFIGSRTLTSPPSMEFFIDPTSTYLFTADLHAGTNQFDLNSYLGQLNAGSGPIYLGLYMNRGDISLNSATLSGTMAPEPVSMALVGAGLVGLPFARRFRKTLAS